MMKKILALLLVCLTSSMVLAGASSVSLYVDAAPNVYGSPDYDPWKTSTFDAIYNGTFENMSNGVNPGNVGTTDFEIQDEVVYSFGDKGLRLTWIYFIEGETVASLEDRITVSLINDWEGSVSDFYLGWYGSTWIEPMTLIDYDADGDGVVDGVFGMNGMAWWGAKGVNTDEALAADIASWGTANETWTYTVKLDGEDTSILCSRDAVVVPAPGAVLLAGLGTVLARRFRRA